jgi:hypothetical protein
MSIICGGLILVLSNYSCASANIPPSNSRFQFLAATFSIYCRRRDLIPNKSISRREFLPLAI